MTRITIALLLSALPAALAYPKHWGFGHAAVHARGTAHKYHSSSSTAPYGEYNSTAAAGPTGTGTGYLVTVTVSPLPVSSSTTGSSSASVAAPQSAESTTTCASSTVTTTYTNRVTVTVQPSSVAAPTGTSSSSSVYSAASVASSASSAAPVVPTVYSSSSASSVSSASSAVSALSASSSSSSLIAYTYSAVSSSSSYVQPTSTSSTSVVSSTPIPVVSSTTTVSSSTSVAAPETIASSSSAAATPSSYARTPPTGTKRGLVYNTASLTSAFTSAPISWAYNWAASTSDLPSQFEFVPMLWGLGDHTKGWAAAASAAVSSGTGYLMGFNEPDEIVAWGGSGLSPADAVTGWNDNIQPFAGGAVKLGSPSVTNAGAPMGLDWLNQFVQQCNGCQIDFLNIHWYCGTGDSVDNAIADFKDHVGKAIAQANGKPIWITEFRYIGSGSETDFINQVLPWLDSNAGVERYSYFMATDGKLLSGTALSATGEAYVSAS